MDINLILLILVGLVAIALVFFLVKTFLKIIIICGIIFLLFHVGFVWDEKDLSEKLSLSKIFNSDKVESAYGEFVNKRKEHEVVDVEELKKVIEDRIHSAITKAEGKVSEIDKEALKKDLDKLKGIDWAVAKQIIDQVKEKLRQANLTEEEIDSIVGKT